MVVLLNLPGGVHYEWLQLLAAQVTLILILRGIQLLQLRTKKRRERKEQRYTTMEEINPN